MKLDLVRRSVLAALASIPLLPIPSDTALAVAPSSLEFMESKSGLRYADFKVGNGPAVAPDSRVTMHIVGRLVGKQGWVFENSQRDEDGGAVPSRAWARKYDSRSGGGSAGHA